MTPATPAREPAGFLVSGLLDPSTQPVGADDSAYPNHSLPVKAILYVAIGAALGGVARYLIGPLIQQRIAGDFPAGTLIINITGSFLLGFIVRYALQVGTLSPELRLFLTTGFCGGYTTFSTFSYEAATLIQDGEYGRAAWYVGASVGIALVGTFAGFIAADQLIALRQR